MLCPLCKMTSRYWYCPSCYKKYEADKSAGRIPEPLTAENYEYGAWVQVQLLKRRGIAYNLPDEQTIRDVTILAESEEQRIANINMLRAQNEERRKRLRAELSKDRFNF